MESVRKDFPFINNNPDIIYFDNAATTLKPNSVVEAINEYNTNISANIHRGEYSKANKASELVEQTRSDVADFINANREEIVFTSGTTQSINLVALGLYNYLMEGDVILLESSAHASNLLPWYELSNYTGAKIEFITLNDKGYVTLDNLDKALHENVKLVCLSHISNVIGHINDIKSITKRIRAYNSLILVDGAQACGHIEVDVKELDVDYYVFSAHKMLGPTGVGILYGKKSSLELLRPKIVGGGDNITFNKLMEIQYKDIPYCFEAGTLNIEGLIGFGAAISYLNKIDILNIEHTIHSLTDYLIHKMKENTKIKIINDIDSCGIVSFEYEGIFAQDVAAYLNANNISVRAGQHCARLLQEDLPISKTVRVSLYFYNTKEEIDKFMMILNDITLEKCLDLYI